jgi:GDSL-like Lipase/Acylhydrolase family
MGFGTATSYTQNLTNSTFYTIANYGVGGMTLAQMIAAYPTQIAPLFAAGFRNVITLWGGTNDFAINGSTVAQVYSLLTQYIALAKATGFTVVVGTMIARTGNNPVGGETLNVDKNAFNALILVNTAGADGIANFTGTNLGCDGCENNATWFQSGGVHPTTLGITSIEGPIWSTAINALP